VEAFDASNPCPRCKSAAADYTYHESACPRLGARCEHWHRECRCGYEWAEATVDERPD
jgi:hypothetical protein